MMLVDKKLILASSSPRRQYLMKMSGIPFVQKTIEFDENIPPDIEPAEVAEYLAIHKARAAKDLIKDREIIMTADTIVIFQNKIYGKPRDEKEARLFLKKLAGHFHSVFTGVCLLSGLKEKSFKVVTKVYLEEMTDSELNYYLQQYHALDKAGAYGIQDWIGWVKVSKIQGSYSNVMGLPVSEVYKALKEF